MYPDRHRLCTHLQYTGVVVENAAIYTVCMYVRTIHGDLHTIEGTIDRS